MKKPLNHQKKSAMNACKLEHWPIENLRLPINQARTHLPDQIEKIKNSIQAFGFLGALLITGEGEIIAGVARLKAAKQLGFDELPVLVADHLSEAQIIAYRLADNKLAELSSWDKDVLRIEFEAILEMDIDFDLEVTGFDTATIDFTLEGSQPEEDDPDDILPEEIALEPVSALGDLWLIGDHRLLCGDAKSPSDYLRLLAGLYPTIVITDPPWNVSITGHVGNSGKTQHREFVEASGEMTDREFAYFLDVVVQQMANNVVKGGLIFCFIDWRGLEKMLAAGRKARLELLNVIVWAKQNAGMGSLYRSKHELVCLFKKPGTSHQNNIQLGATGRYRTNVWEYAGANSFGQGRMEQLRAHPTAKPVVMIADAIKDVTKRGDVVLDPFCGSGTTLLAAERTGRIARCMELDPIYVDTAIRRFEERFGVEAVHQGTGLTFSELAKQRAAEVSELDADDHSLKPDTSGEATPMPRKRPRPSRPASGTAATSVSTVGRCL